MNSTFAKGTPSVFVVCSPFQALCAVSAIKQLEIDDYKMIIYLQTGDVRFSQIEGVLNFFKIKYSTIRASNMIKVNYYRIKPLFRRRNQYNRLFLGDFRRTFLYCIGCGFVSDNSHIVYLDDGNITISLLRGRNTEPMSKKSARLFNYYSKRRGFVFYKNFLTIYSDIPNCSYNIEKLSLDNLSTNNNFALMPNNYVYIIGTNIQSFCGPQQLSEERFILGLDKIISELCRRYPSEDIFYIPHGRETKVYAEPLCEKYGIHFRKPSTTVELDLLSLNKCPQAIYGFTSTALLTLKKIYPSARVINIVFDTNKKDNPYVIDLLDCSRYYCQNGIEQISV